MQLTAVAESAGRSSRCAVCQPTVHACWVGLRAHVHLCECVLHICVCAVGPSLQEEDVIGTLATDEKIASLKPLGDRVLIKVRQGFGEVC